ncbi:MAG: hypothetical protein LBP56_01210 [Odoribacteraceae bacterium]|jgi:uncharacterized protein YeeX (DUF496 family)|nr:hypothetical protein [Odoribacteraceae bacterium]
MINTAIILVGLLLLYGGIKREINKTRVVMHRRTRAEVDEELNEQRERLDELRTACNREERRLACLQVKEIFFDYIQEYYLEHDELITKFFAKYSADFAETPFFKEFTKMKNRLNAARMQVINDIVKQEKILLLHKLNEYISSLSKYDMILLIMTELKYSDERICDVLKIGTAALKQRKTRLKEKILSSQIQVPGKENENFKQLVPLLFEWLQEAKEE